MVQDTKVQIFTKITVISSSFTDKIFYKKKKICIIFGVK